MSAAFKTLSEHTDTPLNAWQRKTLGQSWVRGGVVGCRSTSLIPPSLQDLFSTILHEHHHNEEKIAFPYVATKAPLPEKVSSDHATLVTQLAECAALVRLLVDGKSPNVSQTLAELIPKFETFRAETEAHLVEEEQTAMPLMRHHFTPAEWKKNVENIILKNAKPSDLGWLLRQKKDAKEQRAWMATIAHIPGPVISFVMVPAIAKFEREVTAPMCALIGGATTYTPEPAPGCACTLM